MRNQDGQGECDDYPITTQKTTSRMSLSDDERDVDSYTRTDDVSDTRIDEVAKFAVAAYNRQTGKALVFIRVVRSEHQVLPRGVNYKLVVEAATPAGVTNVYKAVVHEEERKLTFVSFVPVL
ncbi:hypothetical protein Taro_029533 [Colocasia esculenta]|uniref:Cystatin domain-containing protein n=1 Tax=Colocasia esculenta TaxID=4460 RepID=A0A843VJ67_COLES|nr:hypothetical protein [Colocasia esculenta]